MSAWVVTPSGGVVSYPNVTYFQWTEHSQFTAKLYNGDPDRGGRYVASAPTGSVVSFCEPREVRVTAGASAAAIEAALEITAACCERATGWANKKRLAALKKKLESFDARTGNWKP